MNFSVFLKKIRTIINKNKGLLLSLILLLILILLFFIRLYFPPSIFTTPDFGLSDILHFNLPLKEILSENLRSFKIPIWESSIGQGYPIFADSFSGTLYIPNLIIFFILPLNLALPTMYIITFITSAFGTFFLLKHLKLKNLSSIFGAISYTFSATLILRVQHINVLEANSLLPFVLLFYLKFLKKLNLTNLIICALLLSQLFFTGYLQIFTYTFLILIILGPLILKNKKAVIKYSFLFLIMTAITLLLVSVQLLPMYELSTKTQRGSGLDPAVILSSFPLFYKSLLSFFNPFIFGNASNGTYNSLQWDKVGLFWESTAYIGLIPFSLCLVSILTFLKKPKKYSEYLPYLIIFILTLLLALGRLSPLHVMYSFPPLNYFRLPARFIIFSQLFAVILASFMTNYLYKKINNKLANLLITFIILLTIIDLWSKWWSYNPIEPYKNIFNKPESASFIEGDKNNFRIYSLSNAKNWNEVFTKQGWAGEQEYYDYFLNSLGANSNIMWNISNFSLYSPQRPRRYDLQEILLKDDIKYQNLDSMEIGSIGLKLLQQSTVKYITSTIPITNRDLIFKKQLSKEQFYYYIYEVENIRPRLSFYYDYIIVNNPTEYQAKLSEIDPQKTVILEEDINKKFTAGSYNISNYSYSNQKVNIDYTSDDDGLFVLNDSYYPGWHAEIDKTPVKIYPANINSRAIIVPKGKHTIKFYFDSNAIKTGFIISFISYIFVFFFLILSFRNKLKTFKPRIRS